RVEASGDAHEMRQGGAPVQAGRVRLELGPRHARRLGEGALQPSLERPGPRRVPGVHLDPIARRQQYRRNRAPASFAPARVFERYALAHVDRRPMVVDADDDQASHQTATIRAAARTASTRLAMLVCWAT